jgi:hypothetical protein
MGQHLKVMIGSKEEKLLNQVRDITAHTRFKVTPEGRDANVHMPLKCIAHTEITQPSQRLRRDGDV